MLLSPIADSPLGLIVVVVFKIQIVLKDSSCPPWEMELSLLGQFGMLVKALS